MKTGTAGLMILALYRMAWEPALWIARAGASVEHFMPPRWRNTWRLSERLSTHDPRPANVVTDDTTNHSPGGARTRAGEPRHDTYWLHAASLGECKGLWALAQRLAAACSTENPFTPGGNNRSGEEDDGACRGTGGHARRRHGDERHALPRILLTANTITGLAFLQREIAKTTGPRPGLRFHARLAPLDHPRVARAFMDAHAVRVLVLFEVELWPHWIAAARRADIPVTWVSARLTPRARRLYGHPALAGALGRVLRGIAWVQTQTEAEEHALRRLGAPRVETGGDLKGLHALDHARGPVRFEGHDHPDDKRDRENRHTPIPRVSTRPHVETARRDIAFVSFHAHELPTLVSAFNTSPGAAHPEADSLSPRNFLVFPRKLHEVPAFMRVLAPHGFVLHSQRPDAPRVIVDAHGMVEQTLARVHTAVIGGSFGTHARIGGHNAWEPLLAGCRIVIGPHRHNQNALVERLETQGLIRVAHADEALREEIARDPVHPDARLASAEMQTAGVEPAAVRMKKTREEETNARHVFIAQEAARLESAAQRVRAFVLHQSNSARATRHGVSGAS